MVVCLSFVCGRFASLPRAGEEIGEGGKEMAVVSFFFTLGGGGDGATIAPLVGGVGE